MAARDDLRGPWFRSIGEKEAHAVFLKVFDAASVGTVAQERPLRPRRNKDRYTVAHTCAGESDGHAVTDAVSQDVYRATRTGVEPSIDVLASSRSTPRAAGAGASSIYTAPDAWKSGPAYRTTLSGRTRGTVSDDMC
jgi:hypothetical protein